MESNISSGNMIHGVASYGGLDLQGSMRVSHHQQPHGLQQGLLMHEVFPLTMGQNHECDQPNSMANYNKVEKGKNVPSDEDDEHSFNEEGMDGQSDLTKGKKVPHWHRVKWTDSMVRLLITAVSYIGEDPASEGGRGGRRKYLNLQKGKWKSVSKVMAERGFYVSPQQCEDKFNDLTKRYKKLNDILGRGTSCQVVENPMLLEIMDHISEKTKDEVRKILSSKHLFYEEMCSYLNGNRLHLPHDPALQRSLHFALRSRDDHDTDSRRNSHVDDVDEDDHDHEAETNVHEEYEDNNHGRAGGYVDSTKRMKQGPGFDDFGFGNNRRLDQNNFNKGFQLQSQKPHGDIHVTFPDGHKQVWLQNQWLKWRSLQLQHQKVQIELETLELEKQRLKWQRFSKEKDRELEKLRIENDRMKLENERVELELKRMDMTVNCNN